MCCEQDGPETKSLGAGCAANRTDQGLNVQEHFATNEGNQRPVYMSILIKQNVLGQEKSSVFFLLRSRESKERQRNIFFMILVYSESAISHTPNNAPLEALPMGITREKEKG